MRDLKTRKADVLGAFERQKDLWLASADGAGRPHQIAVSAWWDGTHFVIATAGTSLTELAGGFAGAVGWDPREVGGGWMFFRLTPIRIQAYKGYDELEGREVMSKSRWLA